MAGAFGALLLNRATGRSRPQENGVGKLGYIQAGYDVYVVENVLCVVDRKSRQERR
jgi:hypothetical protein